MDSLDRILTKALQEEPLRPEEFHELLGVRGGEEQQKLFQVARTLRYRYFANLVGLYGFVYFSTYCRNDCAFCLYRRSNASCERYRKTTAEIVAVAKSLADSGVHLIDLTMGEDPSYLNTGKEGYDRLIDIVRQVKSATDVPIMISPGVVPKEVLDELKDAGANWYACYQETHNRELFGDLRVDQSYDERWEIKEYARRIEMLTEEGLLVGVGDQLEDAVQSILAMRELGADQVRAMTFVPQNGTPLSAMVQATNRYELNLIAVMRIAFPMCCIPASLDVEGIDGLKDRLNAGANIVTSIIPPFSGLQGVSQSTLDIAEGYRTVEGVRPLLAQCGLKPANKEQYLSWLTRLGRRHQCQEQHELEVAA